MACTNKETQTVYLAPIFHGNYTKNLSMHFIGNYLLFPQLKYNTSNFIQSITSHSNQV